MDFLIQVQQKLHSDFTGTIENLDERDFIEIPSGFNNNVLWNIGHVLIARQVLLYKLSGLPMIIPDEYLEFFGKDTSPAGWKQKIMSKDIVNHFEKSSDNFKDDYEKGAFKNFNEFETVTGLKLKNIEDALIFNYGHEKYHLGVVKSIIKVLN